MGQLAAARVLLTLIVVWLLWSIWRREYREVAPTFQLKQWAGATVPFLLTALVIAALGQSSTLILEAHHPSEKEVGIYAAVQQVAYLPLLALGAISTLARPRLATLLEEGESTQFEQELGSYLRILTLVGISSLVVFLFAGDFLLGLFGHDFKGAHGPLVVLGIGYLFVLIGGLLVPILQMHQEKTFVTATMLALLALNLGLTYPLAPRHGALGAAMAYTISVGVIYAIQLWLLQRKTGIPYVLSMLPRSPRSSA